MSETHDFDKRELVEKQKYILELERAITATREELSKAGFSSVQDVIEARRQSEALLRIEREAHAETERQHKAATKLLVELHGKCLANERAARERAEALLRDATP